MKLPEMPQDAVKVCGVIVTYQPCSERLAELVRAVRPQLTALLIVDNGSDFDFTDLRALHQCEVIELGDNLGIAKAQNDGIMRARTLGADYVLLLDQDSIPAPDMVATLVRAHVDLASSGQQIAAVGPSYVDPRQGEAAVFVDLDGLKLRRRERKAEDKVAEADFLIASGCLIAMSTLDRVGLMVEELFIDYVDVEWGLRARSDGYLSFGVYAAKMEHALGDEWISFRNRRVPLRSPLRHYYHIRNAVWLSRQSWISSSWRIVLLVRSLKQLIFFFAFAPRRFEHLRMMALGLWHGVRGRMGRI